MVDGSISNEAAVKVCADRESSLLNIVGSTPLRKGDAPRRTSHAPQGFRAQRSRDDQVVKTRTQSAGQRISARYGLRRSTGAISFTRLLNFSFSSSCPLQYITGISAMSNGSEVPFVALTMTDLPMPSAKPIS